PPRNAADERTNTRNEEEQCGRQDERELDAPAHAPHRSGEFRGKVLLGEAREHDLEREEHERAPQNPAAPRAQPEGDGDALMKMDVQPTHDEQDDEESDRVEHRGRATDARLSGTPGEPTPQIAPFRAGRRLLARSALSARRWGRRPARDGGRL